MSMINRKIFMETLTSVFSKRVDFLNNNEEKYNFSEQKQDADFCLLTKNAGSSG